MFHLLAISLVGIENVLHSRFYTSLLQLYLLKADLSHKKDKQRKIGPVYLARVFVIYSAWCSQALASLVLRSMVFPDTPYSRAI